MKKSYSLFQQAVKFKFSHLILVVCINFIHQLGSHCKNHKEKMPYLS